MNIVKNIVKAVLPIIIQVLRKQADKTETPLDDIVVEAVKTALEMWINDTQLDVNFGE